MLGLTRCAALRNRSAVQTSRLLSTTTPLHTKHALPFSFLPSNTLDPKPSRSKGLTEIRGPYYAPVTDTYLDELLSDWGEYVDGVKFAGGAFSLMPEDRLKKLIDTCHKHSEQSMTFPYIMNMLLTRDVLVDCYVSTGGFIERVLSTSGGNKETISKYLKTCKNMGYVPASTFTLIR